MTLQYICLKWSLIRVVPETNCTIQLSTAGDDRSIEETMKLTFNHMKELQYGGVLNIKRLIQRDIIRGT
jgi:hypothetical protein